MMIKNCSVHVHVCKAVIHRQVLSLGQFPPLLDNLLALHVLVTYSVC